MAETLKKADSKTEIIFVGTENGLEKNIIDRSEYRLELLPSRPLKRSVSLSFLGFIYGTIASLIKATSLIRKDKPDFVIGMGGFASFAPIIIASVYGIPRLLHEQNSVPGLANRTLGRFCPEVAISYPPSKRHFKKPTVLLTGNPVRKKVLDRFNIGKDEARRVLGVKNVFTILIFGGSRGAQKINEATIEMLPEILGGEDVQLIHIAGKDDFSRVNSEVERIEKEKLKHPVKGHFYYLYDFYDDMGLLYMASDLIVGRAGAMSIAEIMAAGKASILIPYPYSADDHQQKNAEMIKRIGAGKVIENSELTGHVLLESIQDLRKNNKIYEMEQATIDYGKKDAADALMRVIFAEMRTES